MVCVSRMSWGVALAAAVSLDPAMAQEDTNVLPPGVERVLYLPLPDTTSPRVKRQETAIIQRSFRQAKLANQVSILPIEDPEVFKSLEPGFAIYARQARCGEVDTSPMSSILVDTRVALREQRLEDAGKKLEEVRALLTCLNAPMNRKEISEIFLMTGLSLLGTDVVEAELWLRSALAADDTIRSSDLIPEVLRPDVERMSSEVESGPQVDARLSPEAGELWEAKNFRVDGRPVIFDKYFLELVPGWHYLQMSLPDRNTWGALVRVDSGEVADLVDQVRATMGVRTLFDAQMAIALDEGRLEPALAQGLKHYATRLERSQVFLAKMTTTTENTGELTIRRYDKERGLDVPPEIRMKGNENSPFVPVQFVPPWGFDANFAYSQINQQSLSYSTSGLNLELGGRYLLTDRLYGGAGLSGGARFTEVVSPLKDYNPAGKVDMAGSGYVGTELGLKSFALRADLGWLQHLGPLYDIPYTCRLRPDQTQNGVHNYSCAADPADLEGDEALTGASTTFLLKGVAGGPRLRATLVFSPFRQEGIKMQGIMRVAYTPLMVRLPPNGDVMVVDASTPDAAPAPAYYLLHSSDDYSQVFQRIDLGFGVTGTF